MFWLPIGYDEIILTTGHTARHTTGHTPGLGHNMNSSQSKTLVISMHLLHGSNRFDLP